MSKKRLDQLLVECGLVETRSKAQALIMAGSVYVGGQKADKPGQSYPEDVELEVRGEACPFVSRGGFKLAKALTHFGLSPEGDVALDIGASTGGFTDVLLQNGARKVYAVDVGHGQLDWKLRNDARVVVLEKVNARYLTTEQVPELADWLVCDASFISLKTVLPAPMALLKPGAVMVVLIKPQFEAGKGQVGKGGVVRDPDVHASVCEAIRAWMQEQPGWEVLGVTESPVRGPKGNIEFLLAARRNGG